jgi:hypothetical protein
MAYSLYPHSLFLMGAIAAANQLFVGSACSLRNPYLDNNTLTNYPRG